MQSVLNSTRQFARYSWMVVAWLALVILWGAWVRITGSGAGCGNHWPTCHGQVIPLAPTTKTLIEFTHRLTSGLCLPLVLVLLAWSFRLFAKPSPVRKAAVGTLVLLITEALLGAALVKFDLVANNASAARALTASLHLINTFSLCAMAALAAWWAEHPPHSNWSQASTQKWLFAIALGAILISSMGGAVTALGDTLFPTSIFTQEGLFVRLQNDLSGTTHFLVQLRIIHPILAVLSGLYLIFFSASLRADQETGPLVRASRWVTALTSVQLLAGMLNIFLAAPGWMQIVHLLLAVSLWLSTVILTSLGLRPPLSADPCPPVVSPFKMT